MAVTTTRGNTIGAGRPNDTTDADVEHFVATVSHDLQSSLLVLTNNLELLRASYPHLSLDQEDHLTRIERTTQRMQRLLLSVRNYAWANGELELSRIPLEEVVENSVEMLAQAIEQHSAQVVVEGPLPTITGDREQLVQLFENLLSNAIKFGPRRALVTVSADRNGGYWRVKVADHGPGIAPENYDRVFEPFRRLRETGHVNGTGLGLTICMRVARNHGGCLAIEPTEGGGATFVVTLPDRRLDADVEPPGAASQ